jgi:hypothetical protein
MTVIEENKKGSRIPLCLSFALNANGSTSVLVATTVRNHACIIAHERSAPRQEVLITTARLTGAEWHTRAPLLQSYLIFI